MSAMTETFEKSKTYKIESINICLLYPPLKLIGNLLRGTDDGGAQTADSNMFRNGMFRPLADMRRGLAPALNRRADSIALDMAQFLIVAITSQIDTRPAAEQGQSTLDRAVATVIFELGLRLLLRATQHGAEHG